MSKPCPDNKFSIAISCEGGVCAIAVSDNERSLRRTVVVADHNSWIDFFALAAEHFGTRPPGNRGEAVFPEDHPFIKPLLTESVSDRILYGYGDPWVIKNGSFYYLVVTSNDAPDTFPILRSADLRKWELIASAFESGAKPQWAWDEPGRADFWAPELHRLNNDFVLCFSARERRGSEQMAIALATSPAPKGPFKLKSNAPLLTGNVIDSHLFVDDDSSAYLYWKEDNNDRWPKLLIELLQREPQLRAELFPSASDQRTIALLLELIHARPWSPIERFFILQVLIEATVQDYARVMHCLTRVGSKHPDHAAVVEEIVRRMHTPVHGSLINSDSLELSGTSFPVIRNDRDWEGHLIEGICLTKQQGRYFMFYSGNDFSTPRYGIGYAVADTPRGPFRKADEPILTSTRSWWGPGHPSVAPGPDGKPVLFMHAYRAGAAGYKSFRAVLAAKLHFAGEIVSIEPWD